jgi:hypothetical protein
MIIEKHAINETQLWDSFVQELLSPIEIPRETAMLLDTTTLQQSQAFEWNHWNFEKSPAENSNSDDTNSTDTTRDSVTKKTKKRNRPLQPLTEFTRKWKPIFREKYPELTQSQLHKFTVRQFQLDNKNAMTRSV